MNYLPVFLRIRNAPCLVDGGGAIALRKVELLLSAGASVTVVSKSQDHRMLKLIQQQKITHLKCEFSPDLITGMYLVVAATNDRTVNQQVSETAMAQAIPVNVVDQPELSNFIVPSIVDRSPVIVAIGTGGTAPLLGRLLKSRLETLIPAAYGRLAGLAGGFRQQVKAKFDSIAERRHFWEYVLQGPIAELVFSGRDDDARDALERLIEKPDYSPTAQGEVYLVGAGPGDPDLLTFRALRLMQQADVVLYDRLVAREIVDLARRDADRIFVGKSRAKHAVSQTDINRLLVELAHQGKRVLRLKGGDPFIFGRGGEEIADLVRENIPFQVIPGITAASGCAAYAGIPLTHRDHAQSCVFVTGHLKDGQLDLNWSALCQPGQTVVVYMSLTGLETLCSKMIRHGADRDLPAALIQQGTTRNQKVITGTLATLPGTVSSGDIKPPTLLIIGHVVSLRSGLAWYNPDDCSPDTDTETNLHAKSGFSR